MSLIWSDPAQREHEGTLEIHRVAVSAGTAARPAEIFMRVSEFTPKRSAFIVHLDRRERSLSLRGVLGAYARHILLVCRDPSLRFGVNSETLRKSRDLSLRSR
jgi:hypothetical protein